MILLVIVKLIGVENKFEFIYGYYEIFHKSCKMLGNSDHDT